MLYSLFVLVFGIYLGQEYRIPNIRLVGMHLLRYLQRLQNEEEEQKSNSIFEMFK
jgi:hypothetical protein